MTQQFTSWQSELTHYGIPGMRWGVRRYQNKDGSLTQRGSSRYGASGTGRTARQMQRDYNSLDKGRANLEARRQDAAAVAQGWTNKLNRRVKKLKKQYEGMTQTSRHDNRDLYNSDPKIAKYKTRIQKYAGKAQTEVNRRKAVEKLQSEILRKATEKGYTVRSKAVLRAGTSVKREVENTLSMIGGMAVAYVGGVGVSFRNPYAYISGNSVKIREKK